MAEAKTQPTKVSAVQFLDAVKNDRRRKDGKTLHKMMRTVSKKKAVMWGPSIVGYGKHKYDLANGKQGDIFEIGFSPRAQSLVLYLGRFKSRDRLLKKLGKHKEGAGACIYINKLDDVDLDVLEQMIVDAFESAGKEK